MQKEFPKWVPYAGFPPKRGLPGAGAGAGAGAAAPSSQTPRLCAPLHRRPLFKQKTSRPATPGRLRRPSPVSGEPRRTAADQALRPPEGPTRPRAQGAQETGGPRDGRGQGNIRPRVTVRTPVSQGAGTARPRPQTLEATREAVSSGSREGAKHGRKEHRGERGAAVFNPGPCKGIQYPSLRGACRGPRCHLALQVAPLRHNSIYF